MVMRLPCVFRGHRRERKEEAIFTRQYGRAYILSSLFLIFSFSKRQVL
jgi:hypothetical protein